MVVVVLVVVIYLVGERRRGRRRWIYCVGVERGCLRERSLLDLEYPDDRWPSTAMPHLFAFRAKPNFGAWRLTIEI